MEENNNTGKQSYIKAVLDLNLKVEDKVSGKVETDSKIHMDFTLSCETLDGVIKDTAAKLAEVFSRIAKPDGAQTTAEVPAQEFASA